MDVQKGIIRFIIFYLIIGFQACEEATDWELKPGNNGNLVVEAILTNELLTQQIRLSQTYDGLNGTAPAVTDAVVRVDVNNESIAFFADTLEAGVYKSKVPFAVIADLTYALTIDWQGKTHQANSELSNVAPLPEIGFRQIRHPDSLAFTDFAPLYNANQQAMYEMNVDWSHLTTGELTEAKMIFYTFSSVDVSELIPPGREIVIFPRGSIVVAKKFGLNDDFAQYLRSLVIETEWNGGVFYGASASLPTNISNGGLGFFSTCAVLSDTVIAK